MPTTTKAAEYKSLAILRSGRSLALDELAREQAVLNAENETALIDEEAAGLNAASFRDRGERNFSKNQYRRHAPQHRRQQSLLCVKEADRPSPSPR